MPSSAENISILPNIHKINLLWFLHMEQHISVHEMSSGFMQNYKNIQMRSKIYALLVKNKSERKSDSICFGQTEVFGWWDGGTNMKLWSNNTKRFWLNFRFWKTFRTSANDSSRLQWDVCKHLTMCAFVWAGRPQTGHQMQILTHSNTHYTTNEWLKRFKRSRILIPKSHKDMNQ